MISLNKPGSSAALVSLLVLSISGCSQTSSENVTTQGIRADILVIAEGLGATVVKAQLEVGSGGPGRTMLNLAPGDSLTVTANGIEKTMVKDISIIGEIEYYASYPFDDAGTQFVVSLNRNNGVSAPNSNVILPEGFVVMLPTSGTVFSSGQVIDVVWAPSGTDRQWRDLDCGRFCYSVRSHRYKRALRGNGLSCPFAIRQSGFKLRRGRPDQGGTPQSRHLPGRSRSVISENSV